MRSSANLICGLVFILSSALVAAQDTLGELLDAGAKKVSAQQFRDEIMQRIVEGPTAGGGNLEIMYVANGTIQGQGRSSSYGVSTTVMPQVNGNWTIDNDERICTSMSMGYNVGVGPAVPVVLPPRCQYWFKLDDKYFISDTDWDRRAKVLSRVHKKSSPAVGVLADLGQLLDAGAMKVSAAEFKKDLVQRTLAGPTPGGAGVMEFMYVANGSIQGRASIGLNATWFSSVSGDWTVADGERVCTTMQIRGGPGDPGMLPQRCQFWFKLGDAVYVSESDSDRRANVLGWTLRP